MSFVLAGELLTDSTEAPEAYGSQRLTCDPIEVSPYFSWSAAVGRIFGTVLLLAAAPVIFLLVVLVRCSSPGPGLYRQRRVGMGGREFWLYKIRTMRSDAEAATGPVWTQENDPRVTRLGRFLRALHLDEFPQLWNVMRGEMSLIGPRPERPEFTTVLTQQIPEYAHRVAVRPGITGLAQINLPPDTDLDSVRRKLQLDRDYVREANWWLDLRILLCTFFRLLGIKGYRAARLLKLRRKVLLPGEMRTRPAAPQSVSSSVRRHHPQQAR